MDLSSGVSRLVKSPAHLVGLVTQEFEISILLPHPNKKIRYYLSLEVAIKII